ncbi:MAG TPA: ester cyclase [Frankiaceae bacterium]|jgi:predicted ester cyclase|nr:ester cyclase [Frankiaceae bacterium]
MDTTANKRTVRRVFEEGFTAGNADVVDECLSPDAVDRHPFGDDEPDFRAHLKGVIRMLRGAMPDLHAEVDDLVGEGDRVAARVSMTGTHAGEPLFGIPATGGRIRIEQFHIIQFNDEALGIRHWAYAGIDQMLSQLAGPAAA